MSKQSIITGLDIGSGTIKILSAFKKKGEENFEVLSESQEVSSGIRRGVVIDVDKVAEIINSLANKVSQDCGQKIKEVYANIGGSHLFCNTSRGLVSVSRADQKISEEDINRVLQAAQTLSLPPNKEVLEIFPKDFIVEGEKGIKDPLGMEGVRLEVDALVVCGFSPYLKNSNQALLNSGLQILDLLPAPIASAKAVLTPREKELGVLLLDIGAGTTSLAVFEEGNLIDLAVFPVGSGNITNDIAICLKTDMDTAEKIKIEFGTCILEKKTKKRSPKNELMRIESLSSGEPILFSKKILLQIIEARIGEILKEVQKELKKIGKTNLLPAGVVLTGGGAKLPKIRDFCKRELKLSCRIGKARGFSPEINDPALSSVCGLISEGFDSGEERDISLSGAGIFAKIKRAFKIFIP